MQNVLAFSLSNSSTDHGGGKRGESISDDSTVGKRERRQNERLNSSPRPFPIN